MSFTLIPSLRRLAGLFARDTRGNVAVIFAVTLVPLLGLIGAAVDYSRANSARTALQSALDSTALMIAKDISTIPTSQIQSTAQNYFNALYNHPEAPISNFTVVYTPNSGSGATVQITANGAMQTDFLKFLGASLNQLSIGSSSTTTWGQTKLRVALVLDNTGSMNDSGKITALRTAATDLVNTLSATAVNPGDVMFSLIPFAKDVNMGSSNYGANWIDWTDWQNPPTQQSAISYSLPSNWSSIGPGSSCPFGNNGRPYNFGCTANSTNGSASTNSIPSNGNICPSEDSALHKFYNGCWNSVPTTTTSQVCSGTSNCSCGSKSNCSCTSTTTTTQSSGRHGGTTTTTTTTCNQTTAGAPYTHTWTANDTSTWSGCLTDRTQDYDTQNTAPTSGDTLFPADQYYENSESYCAKNNSPPLQPIMPLTTNFSTLKSNIASMQPTGGTNQAIGLAWGWMSLIQGDPLNPTNATAEDPNYQYKRIIILLSDGLNTEDRWPSYGNGNTQSFTCGSSTYGCIDLRQQQLCNNIKGATDSNNVKLYTIYTIQVNTGGDPTSAVLQNCASDPTKSAILTAPGQIITTFAKIGAELSALRISK